MEGPVASLSLAAAMGRPVTTAEARVLEVTGALGGLFPEGGLRRGSVVTVVPHAGGVSLALALAGAATGEGGWVAAVGLPSLGVVAAGELGVRLDRLALVPDPGERWPAVAAALLDGVDLLLLGVACRVRPTDARRLVARAREQGTVLMVLGGGGAPAWPDAPDLRLWVAGTAWEGLSDGHGRLVARRLEVAVGGRRAAARERRVSLWLPGRETAVQGAAVHGPGRAPARLGAPAPAAAVG